MSPSARSDVLDRIAHLVSDPETDVLIIGGGINGISTFRDLALQGVKVVLVERNDFCSGASAASSHMIHGGIRYLENGELRLVRESVIERNRLLGNAPHYVKPLPTVIPMFSLFSGLLSAPLKLLFHRGGKPKERGALLIRVGLIIYDLFGRNGGSLPRHKVLGRKKSLEQFPDLHSGIKYTAHYYDAAIENPERLALELLLDGEACGGHARSANYLEAVGVDGDHVVLRDRVSGTEMRLRARVIVNTSGPWTDNTNRSLGLESAFMGGTKGSHIVVENQELFDACRDHEVFFENKDGRIVLMYPLLGKVLIGTTDIPIDNPDDAVCTEEEIDYFFDLASHVFPHISLDRSQIVYRFSGVRPLPRAEDVNPGVISRDYRIEKSALGSGQTLFSLVGGKWTTFRALGEHLADEVLDHLGYERRTRTEKLPIGGGRDYPVSDADRVQWVARHTGSVSSERAADLLARYGTVAERVIDDIGQGEDIPLRHVPGYTRAEVHSLVRREKVVALTDLTHRRTPLAFTGRVSEEALTEIAEVMGDVLGWSAAERKRQVAQFTR